jgi:hypothetical protein
MTSPPPKAGTPPPPAKKCYPKKQCKWYGKHKKCTTQTP